MQKRQSPGLVSDGTNTDGVKETNVNTQFRSRDPVKMALSVGSHPTLMAYLRRVGATERNFRKHVIVVADEYAYMGGKREIATIKIEEDGTVDCNIKDYEPTADEQKAIKAEVGAAPFPKSINARKTMVPPQLVGVDPKHYFVFPDQYSADEVRFIQWRRDDPKQDLPLSFWSDGEWRMMEPDGLLPLWGLDQLKNFHAIFIHEGAKGARDVRALVDKGGVFLAAHPWSEDLRDAAHLGWPGGATNSDRVDWSPIKKLSPHARIIIVADNDRPGVDAVTKISSTLKRSLLVVRFDNKFPEGFDLADPWPKRPDWWRDNGHYVGPSFNDCLSSATWATQTVKTGGKGRPSYVIRNEFADEWRWMSQPLFVHHKLTDRLLSENMFNHEVRPFSDTDDTGRLLLKKLSSKVDGVIFDPAKPRGTMIINGRRVVNTYRPPTVKAVKGDPKPFIDYMEHLIPDDTDRLETLRWCATLIARPDIKMTYGLLLISETQGVGKSTLGESILQPLIGDWNVSVPSEKEIVNSSFNSWIAHKRLAIIHEIYAGHSLIAYNRLKSVITDKEVRVNKKFTPEYEIEVAIHVFACSNSLRALKLDDTDRRWLVPKSRNRSNLKSTGATFTAGSTPTV